VLKIVHEGPVAWVTLNRPERLNALNRVLSQALLDFFTGLRQQLATRVVILQGAGRAFCAGLDLQERKQRQAGGPAAEAGNPFETQHRIRDIMIAMRRCPQPVIAICQGAASGGGFTLALASDVRLVTPDARMNAAFIKIGLTGCDMGSSYFLPRLVGSSVASELLLTGRFINAARGVALGLFSQVGNLDELQTEARALANDMLATSPLGLRLTKEGLQHAIDGTSMDAVMAMEDRQQVLCAQGPDFAEAVDAFMHKRPPAFAQRI
jgi:enoyl-CoA hydratase/carnithine racemase